MASFKGAELLPLLFQTSATGNADSVSIGTYKLGSFTFSAWYYASNVAPGLAELSLRLHRGRGVLLANKKEFRHACKLRQQRWAPLNQKQTRLRDHEPMPDFSRTGPRSRTRRKRSAAVSRIAVTHAHTLST